MTDYTPTTASNDHDLSIADSSEPFALSSAMLEQHRKGQGGEIKSIYEPIIGGLEPMFDFLLPTIDELATATDFNEGEIRTNENTYFLVPDDRTPWIKTIDGEETHLHFLEGSAFRTPEQTLSFLKSMKSNIIDNIDPKILTSHINLLKIISQAVVEIILARHVEINAHSGQNVEVYVTARTKLDGSIMIELEPNGARSTGVSIDAKTVIISVGFDDNITGPYARIEQDIPPVSIVEAMRLQKSASATLSALGLTDFTKLIEEIDEYLESD
jgi:hypothetical protein